MVYVTLTHRFVIPSGVSRAKKIALINRMNPSWLDLGANVLQDM